MAQDFSEEFQRRRRRFFRLMAPVAVIGLGCFGAAFYLIEQRYGDEVVAYAMGPFFLAIVTLIFAAYFLYRCPGCDKLPVTAMPGGHGMDLDPYECGRCGAVLKHEI